MKQYSQAMWELAKARQQPVKAPQHVLDALKRIREQLAKGRSEALRHQRLSCGAGPQVQPARPALTERTTDATSSR
jgi:hypothetical protein